MTDQNTNLEEPDILFIVPCDDVRVEANGKFIAVGIYTEAMVLDSFPNTLMLSFLVWLNMPKGGKYRIALQAHVEPCSTLINDFGFEVDATAPVERSAAILQRILFPIESPGAIVITSQKTGNVVLKLPVRSSSTALPQRP